MMYYIYIYIYKKNKKNNQKQLHKALPFKNGDRERAECNKRISNCHISHERWSSFVTCAKTCLISCQKASRWTRVSSGGEDIAHADNNSIKMAQLRRQTEELCFSPV